MNDFRAKIVAELDTSQVEQQLKDLDGKKVKLGVDGGDTAKKEIDKVDSSIKRTAKSSKTFGDTLKTSLNIGTAATITAKGFRLVENAAQEAVEAVKDFDSAITDLRMATGGDYAETRGLVKNYNELGKEIGATTKEVSNSADTWFRQGHSISETNTLVKDSMILSKVANLESAESTKYLTSATKGYSIEVENTIDVVDKLLAVDLKAAVNAAGIAEGMSKTATSANLANVSLDRLIGYLSAVGEVTQEDMSTIGNAFKTFFARYSAIKAGKLELIDEDGTTEILSDVEQALKNVGIDMRSTITEFDSASDSLDALAEKWNTLSSIQKSAIASAFGGTRQKDRFLVLMENYSNAMSYAETAANSAGTAEEKFSAYLDSIEAKTKSLQASFESLAFNTLSTEMFGGIVDATAEVITFVDETNILQDALLGLATAGAIKGFMVFADGISNASVKLNAFNNSLELLRSGNIGQKEMASLTNMITNLSKSQLKAVLTSEVLNNEQRMAILTAQGLSTAEAQAALASMGLATAEGTATVATTTFSGALKGLWATIKANPIFLVATAITAVVAISAKLYESFDEACEKAKEARSSFESVLSELESLESELIATKERIDELNSLDSLSLVEEAELKNLQEQNLKLEYQYQLKKRIADLEQQKAAKAAYDVLNRSTFLTTGENINIVDLTSRYVSKQKHAKRNVSAGIENGWDEDAIRYWEEVVSNYDDLIADNLKIIDENYTSLLDSDGNALPGYESIVKSIEDLVDSTLTDVGRAEEKERQIEELLAKSKFTDVKKQLLSTNDSKEIKKIIDNSNELKTSLDGAGISADELTQYLNSIPDEVPVEVNTEKLGFIDTISQIESLSTGFDQLNKIYSDVKDREDFDYSSLLNNKDFEDAFGDLDSYNDFIETITNSPNDIKSCQEAFNDLAGQYLLNSDALKNLNKDNKDAIIAFLEQKGVVNANEIVNRKLTVDQEKLRTETELGTDAKYDEIEALYKEAVAGSVAQQALAQLAIEKWNFNDNKIETAEDAEKLLELANAARLTGAELVKLEAAKSVLDEVKSGSSRGFWLLEHGEYEKALETLNGNFETKYDPVSFEDIVVNGGISKDSGSSKTETAADKFNDYVGKFFDWIEIRLDRLQAKSDKYLSKAEKYLEAGKYKSAKTQYGNLLDNTATQITTNRRGATKYQNKANKILDKAVSQGLVSQKGANNIKKKVADGTIDISSYSEDVRTVIENYQEWYEKSLTASENIVSLSEAYVEYAEALANIPLDKLKAKLEDIDFENDVLDAKYEVVTGGDGKKSIAFQKNSILRYKDDNALEIYNAKMTAVDDTTADVNSAWKDKSLKDVKSNKYNKGKKKGEELSTKGLKEGSKAYRAVIAYNAALKAQKEALKEAETAEYKYTATLQENAKERFENAKNQYEGDKAINDAEKARAEAVIESLNTNGKSLYGTDAKTAYESAIKENQDAIGIAENELLKMRNQYAKEANTLSDEDRKQAEADIINKESEILNLKTGTKELQDELNSLPLKQLQTEFSDLQTDANELQNALSLKEAKGIRILKSDYEGLIENSQQQIYNLQWQNDELRNQQKGLEKGSQRYEELQDQIDANNESIRNAEQNQVEFNNAIAQLPFDEYEKALELLDAIGNNLKSQADLKESQGVDLSESDYLEQIANETAAIEELQGKKSEAYKNYFKALASVDGAYGGKSSDEWLKEYHGYDTEINNTKASIEELEDAMRDDVFWRTFERAHEDAERLSDTLDSISSLISDEMAFDADGNLTDYGVSKVALLVKQYETARDEVKNFSKDIDNLNRLYAQDEYTPEEYKEELAELQKGLLDAASSMQSFSDSIVDMYENVARSELDSLLELIDARNEALAAKKAYYDYDKTIRDKTKDIQAIEAQLAALQGIDTLEAKSKRVTLEAELAEAQEELDDTVNEHLIEISQDSLSELSETLEKSFDENWQNIHSSLEETSQIIKDASELATGSINDINENVEKLLTYYGITPDDVGEDGGFTGDTTIEEITLSDGFTDGIDMAQNVLDNVASTIKKSFGLKSYAKGTKGVSKSQLAWTQENNKPEIIVRKRDGAILTPLEPDDSVIPNNLSERLFALAKENAPQHIAYKMPEINYSEFGGSNVNFAPAITQKFDNMINIQGSADAATVEDLKKFSKDILEDSYKYTSSKIFEGQKRAGGKRRI